LQKLNYENGEMKPEICFDDPKIIALCHAIIQQFVPVHGSFREKIGPCPKVEMS
jgi:hypothetical protein